MSFPSLHSLHLPARKERTSSDRKEKSPAPAPGVRSRAQGRLRHETFPFRPILGDTHTTEPETDRHTPAPRLECSTSWSCGSECHRSHSYWGERPCRLLW